MCLVHPFIDKEPNMVLIEAVKDGNPMIKIEPPLIVYDLPGKYTKRILKYMDHIYKRHVQIYISGSNCFLILIDII